MTFVTNTHYFMSFFIILLLIIIIIVGNISLKYLIVLYFHLFIFSLLNLLVWQVRQGCMVWGALGGLQAEPLPYGPSRAPTCCCNTVVNNINYHCFLPILS